MKKQSTENLVLVAGFVPPQVSEAVKQLAEKEERTISQAVRRLLEESPRVKSFLRTKKRAA